MDVSEAHVRRLLSRGDLRGHRVGRVIRVYAESIDDFQRRNEYHPAPAPRAQAHRGQHKSEALRSAEAALKRLVFT